MARTATRIYVPLDVTFFDDVKVVDAGEAAAWLYLNMMVKAKQLDSDGLMSEAQIERLRIRGWRRRLDALVAVGLVAQTLPGVYVIVGWLNWNESRDARAARLKADRDRKKGDDK